MADDVDPRFAPEYQRGYDPARHGTPRRTRSPEPSPPVGDARGGFPEPETATRVTDAATPDEAELPDEPPRRNPVLVALPVMGIALVAAFVVVLVVLIPAFERNFTGPTSVDEVALLTIAPGVLPALLVGGLLAITIWLTLLSIQPRRGDV